MSCNYDNHWIKHFWRPAIAFTYIIICLVDFVFMPFAFEYIKARDRLDDVVEQIDKIDNPEVQLALIKRADYAGGRSWEPMTTKDGGLFHLSFGAIITGTAVVRGMKRPDSAAEKQS